MFWASYCLGVALTTAYFVVRTDTRSKLELESEKLELVSEKLELVSEKLELVLEKLRKRSGEK
ncbi:hypothetical protein F511_37078 [Dorcoceras hygrometricum]|uniref:Uncharacterized protein n=1 Tax=Dorcoceras hygrometricum TaxID=472368 RepID=A0A2Z7CPY8_9LAMI|nr:hypothetical protein F511_37078 [Dorcoceras hygrometricum]